MTEINVEQEIAENVIGCFENWGGQIEFAGHTARRTNVFLGDPQTEMTCIVEGYGEFRISVIVERIEVGPEDDGALRDELAVGVEADCQTCDSGGHECGGCGHSIAHGARDCRGAGGPGCPVYEELSEQFGDPRKKTCSNCRSFEDDVSTWCDCLRGEPHGDSPCEGPSHHPKDCPKLKSYEMTEAEKDAAFGITEVRAGRLAEGDEIWSDATGRWHEVIEAGSHNGSTTIVVRKTETSTHRFQPKPETLFRTRRGPAGRAADMLGGEVIHSG